MDERAEWNSGQQKGAYDEVDDVGEPARTFIDLDHWSHR